MPIVTRRFVQVEPKGDPTSRPLSAFDAEPALVVLGDPGAGKSTSFRTAAKAEDGAEYVSVRDFLALSLSRWQGRRLYLDGLDEQRSKTSDGAGILDHVRARLDHLGRPSFRLSCRAADWYGASDLAALQAVSPTESVTVVRLEPLSEQDIHDIAGDTVPDGYAFVEEAKRRGLYEFLVNPQTLQLILAAVSEKSWPATRSELYEQGVRILAREVNLEHGHLHGPTFSSEDILSASGYLCAVHLCAGTAGISLASDHDSHDFPFIGEWPGNRDALAIAARRRTFQAEGPSRVCPIHRTVAEYLGARYLAQELNGNLSLGRVLALITGWGGGTLSDLRGLYAWLACLCPRFAESLIPKDPLAVVLYSDPAILGTSTKLLVMKSLADLSQQNPWFRSDDWASRPFGTLCSPEMESEFRRILTDPSQHPAFLSCVLDAIANGHPLPQLGDLLLSIASDGSRPEFVRREAISAFHNACPGRPSVLPRLLDSIHDGTVSDPTCALRGDLLDLLYPGTIPPGSVASYLVDEPEGHVTPYTMFVSRDLVARTPLDALPSLLDSLSARAAQPHGTRKLIWRDSIGGLVLKLLTRRAAEVEPGVVYEWLGKTLDQHGEPILDREESQAIRERLEGHSSLIPQLFLHWLATTPFNGPALEEHYFWRRLYRATPPEGFPRWLLGLASTENRSHVAHFLFCLLVQYTTVHGRGDGLTLEELFAFVEQHPAFRRTLETELAYEIPDWRIEEAAARQERARKVEARRCDTVDRLQQNIDAIRSGSALGHLQYLAKLYYGLFSDVDRDLSPEARLTVETNAGIAEVARQAFIAVLRSRRIPTPRQIAETRLQTREYFVQLPVLAGMELLVRERPDAIPTLPDRTLEAALAFFHLGETTRQPDWMRTLVTRRPELVARALRSFWAVHLQRHSQYVPGVHDLLDEHMAEVARLVAVPLLRKFPACREEPLRVLLLAGMKASPIHSLLAAAREALSRRNLRGIQKIFWLATAFLLQPARYETSLARYARRKSVDGAATLLTFLHPSPTEQHSPSRVLATDAMVTLVRLFGPVFPPEALSGSGWLGLESRGRGAGSVQSLIDHLKKAPSSESTLALATLREYPALRKWKEYLGHAVAEQARHRREATFRYPDLPKVLDTLRNGRPGSAKDLQYLLLDQLSALHQRLRHGPTDGYKTFWNVDSSQRPTSPKPEEFCRDRFIDLLQPLMSPFEVTLEPEGHHADDKRVDIKCLALGLNIPLEIKRHYHRQLWTAPIKQLKRLYSRDPGAQGRGIYLVLWFGLDCKPLPGPPRGIEPVSGPEGLRAALQETLPKTEWDLIQVVIFDCSRARSRNGRPRPVKKLE